ncbi:MAG: hypothetical protein MR029_08710 [Clostridium sp.]|nr:hypothetical protein [Clostridium sp.]
MEELERKLKCIPGAYEDFVIAVLNYAKRKLSRQEIMLNYVDTHMNATPSQILRFIASQEDFYEFASNAKVS